MTHPPKQDESHLNPQENPSRFKFKPKRFNAFFVYNLRNVKLLFARKTQIAVM